MEDKYVCKKCIEDEGLQRTVEKYQDSVQCSYCKKKPAALLETIVEHMMAAISTEYGDVEDNLDVNGQLPNHFSVEVVFSEVGFGLENDDLMDDVVSAFGSRVFTLNQENDFLYRERLVAWDNFQELVKHERRYTFSSAGDENDPDLDRLLWSPRNLLDNVSKTISEFSLIKSIDVSSELWRVQVHKSDKILEVPKHFTSPPREFARYSNRMSPAGVPMFYGASDFETAVLEVVDPESNEKGDIVSGICFKPKYDYLILDLTDLPHEVSFFSDFNHWQRMGIGFLQSFVYDLSRPIKKDGREHIEYVPTQVFTEYVRHECGAAGEDVICGIKYPSSKNGRGCYVIFAEQDACLSSGGRNNSSQLLEAMPNSFKSIPIKN